MKSHIGYAVQIRSGDHIFNIFVVILWFHQSCIRLQIGSIICAIPTTDAVATGEDICYNFIGYSQCFRRRSARGIVTQYNDPWLARMERNYYWWTGRLGRTIAVCQGSVRLITSSPSLLYPDTFSVSQWNCPRGLWPPPPPIGQGYSSVA